MQQARVVLAESWLVLAEELALAWDAWTVDGRSFEAAQPLVEHGFTST